MASTTPLTCKLKFMKRFVVTGAECTGKSTLTKALSGYYSEPWTAEYVRKYVDHIKRELKHEDLEQIAKGQIKEEDAALLRARRFLIHDTNLLSSIIYAKYYFSEEIGWVKKAFMGRDYTLYLLCSPEGVQWKADPGQREGPADRIDIHNQFKEQLESLSLPYTELVGEEEARIKKATKAIDLLL